MNSQISTTPSGLLGDSPTRDYARKLQLFNAFAAPELRRAISTLDLQPGIRVLDAGCGTGEVVRWLGEVVGSTGMATGIDLAASHVAAARTLAPADITILQADLRQVPLAAESFDRVWCANTINHLRDPLGGVKSLAALLRPGGRLGLAQSALLADMYFAWDARLERMVNEAVRRYYRERYGLDERELTAVRAIAGLLRAAGLRDVQVQTFAIERLSPLRPPDEEYLLEAIFRNTWGERLRPYLAQEDYEELVCLCDPNNARFALRRPDFHFIQTFSTAIGSRI